MFDIIPWSPVPRLWIFTWHIPMFLYDVYGPGFSSQSPYINSNSEQQTSIVFKCFYAVHRPDINWFSHGCLLVDKGYSIVCIYHWMLICILEYVETYRETWDINVLGYMIEFFIQNILSWFYHTVLIAISMSDQFILPWDFHRSSIRMVLYVYPTISGPSWV